MLMDLFHLGVSLQRLCYANKHNVNRYVSISMDYSLQTLHADSGAEERTGGRSERLANRAAAEGGIGISGRRTRGVIQKHRAGGCRVRRRQEELPAGHEGGVGAFEGIRNAPAVPRLHGQTAGLRAEAVRSRVLPAMRQRTAATTLSTLSRNHLRQTAHLLLILELVILFAVIHYLKKVPSVETGNYLQKYEKLMKRLKN